MHPVLFEIPGIRIGSWSLGPIPIRMYGLMIGIGFLVAVLLASRRAKKEGLNPGRVMDLGMYLLLAAAVGARVLYVLVTPQDFTSNPLDVFSIGRGGFVFYGGLIAAVPAGIWYVQKHDMPVWKTADIIAPFIALSHAFGRLGCFFAGCCYGSSCSGPLCVTFQDSHSPSPLGVPLFPTQLVESGGEFMIFGVLMVIWRHRKFDGQLFWLYPLFYSILRFILEFFRGDADRGLHFGGLISTSQVIAVFVLGFSGFMLSRLSKTSNENDDRRTHIGA